MKSWVESANAPETDFPLENLPFGVFHHAHNTRIGIAIGDEVLDLRACATDGLLKPIGSEMVDACKANVLNPLMSLGLRAASAVHR